MTVMYWATMGNKKVGPFPTREEALEGFNLKFPFTGESYEAIKPRVTTGYGLGGPWFDIQFHSQQKVQP
jgi:hypothetical protein